MNPDITRPLHSTLKLSSPKPLPAAMLAPCWQKQDLSQQSHGATAILWKAPQHWSRHGTATHRSGHCLAHGLAPSGSSESWGDVTHTETLPGVWSITPRHSWDPSRSSTAKKGEFASHQKGDPKRGMREKQAGEDFQEHSAWTQLCAQTQAHSIFPSTSKRAEGCWKPDHTAPNYRQMHWCTHTDAACSSPARHQHILHTSIQPRLLSHSLSGGTTRLLFLSL